MPWVPSILIYDPVGEFAELSNYSAHSIIVDGEEFQTVEHFFQASKFSDSTELRESVKASKTPQEAKDCAWEYHQFVRLDWAAIKNSVMLQGVHTKIDQHVDVKNSLLRTHQLPIFEDSLQDSYWGIGVDGDGENNLGVTLHKVRDLIFNVETACPNYTFSERPLHHHESRMGLVSLSEWKYPHVGNLPYVEDILPLSTFTQMDIAKFVLNGLRELNLQVPKLDDAWEFFTEDDWLKCICNKNSEMNTETLEPILRSLISDGFDEKYASYSFKQDARSKVDSWPQKFRYSLKKYFAEVNESSRLLVVGAGGGNEAQAIWKDSNVNTTLVDVGKKLTDNCRYHAPNANVFEARAESLSVIADSSQDIYVSLRAFQSVLFDLPKAFDEANRVLTDNGLLYVTISDGYAGKNGDIVRGQIRSNKIDPSATFNYISLFVDEMIRAGFENIFVEDLETEWAVIGRKSNLNPS